MKRIPPSAVTLPLVAAALVSWAIAGALIGAVLTPTDECPHPDGEHEFMDGALDELQGFAEGEVARAKRMQRMLQDIHDDEAFALAVNAERRR